MDILNAFIIIGVAALAHASFQLSVSVLTLLSSHTIGRKRSHGKLLRLMTGFIGGVATMTMLCLSFTALVLSQLLHTGNSMLPIWWAGVSGLLLGVGLAAWLFYYRRDKGTTIWLPRGFSRYLTDRTKSTKRSIEAFSLGLSSVVAELLFIIAPILVSALVLIQLPPLWQIVGLITYTLISLISLFVVGILVGGGTSLSKIQRWREANKQFLQFSSGAGLIALGFYLYVDRLVAGALTIYGG